LSFFTFKLADDESWDGGGGGALLVLRKVDDSRDVGVPSFEFELLFAEVVVIVDGNVALH
jgi:hypothetical protein